MNNEPSEIIHTVVVKTCEELPKKSFMCVQCGEQFDCIKEIEDHVLMVHDFVLVNVDGKWVTYSEFMDVMGQRMAMNILKGGQPNDSEI
jgi:hypothetical protein